MTHVLHPDDREPTRQLWTDSVAGRGPYDVEYRVRALDGKHRWFKTRGVPIPDGAGKLSNGSARAPTSPTSGRPRKCCELARGGFAGRSRTRPSASPTPTLRRPLACGANQRFVRHSSGYSRRGTGRQETARDVDASPTTWPASIDGSRHFGRANCPPSGWRSATSARTARLYGNCSPRSSGTQPASPLTTSRLLIISRCANGWRRQLRASEERRRLILNNANDAFVAMSPDGLITEWNRQAEVLFGWARAEAVGRVLADTIIPPQYREAHAAAWPTSWPPARGRS